MTKLLEKAISRIRELPEDRQDELAEMLLDCADQPKVILTPEQIAEVELAIQEADEGKFATDEEMAALWKRAGL
jgi:predicted transcriptional regulator